MSSNDLIRDFDKVRKYIHDFYINSYKTKSDYLKYRKGRTYTYNVQLISQWLNDYMTESSRGHFHYLPYININSKESSHNPLNNVWKTRVITNSKVFCYFVLMDIFCGPNVSLSRGEIQNAMENYYPVSEDAEYDYVENTDGFAKILRFFVQDGILEFDENKKYRRCHDDNYVLDYDALDFFSEAVPCGILGSFILDQKAGMRDDIFSFKHHYIAQVLDSDILCIIFDCISSHRSVSLSYDEVSTGVLSAVRTFPLKVITIVQTGRQYMVGYEPVLKKYRMYRLDYITDIEPGDIVNDYDVIRKEFRGMEKHMWGASGQIGGALEDVCFVIKYNPDEAFIPRRLEREKRCGEVRQIAEGVSEFIASVYDSNELIPWMSTYIGRIVSYEFSNKTVEATFKSNIHKLYSIYGIEE